MSNKIYKKFLFNRVRDKDILDWLELLDNQSEEVRKALRLYMAHQKTIPIEPTLTDVLDEVRALSEQLANIKIVQGKKVENYQEPPDLVAKLKDFGTY